MTIFFTRPSRIMGQGYSQAGRFWGVLNAMSHFAPTSFSSVVNFGTFRKQNLIRCEVIIIEEWGSCHYHVYSKKQISSSQICGCGTRYADAHMKSLKSQLTGGMGAGAGTRKNITHTFSLLSGIPTDLSDVKIYHSSKDTSMHEGLFLLLVPFWVPWLEEQEGLGLSSWTQGLQRVGQEPR